jgi:hypothetical protein
MKASKDRTWIISGFRAILARKILGYGKQF